MPREAKRGSSILAVALVVDAAVLTWAVCQEFGDGNVRYPAVPVAAAAFLVMQMVLPQTRFDSTHVLGPANIAWLLLALQLILVPGLITLQGPAQGTLQALPSESMINTAILLQVLAYVCYGLGLSLATSRPVRSGWTLPPSLSLRVAQAFLIIGLVGIALRFRSPAALVAYYTGQLEVSSSEAASVGEAAATFLRPFAAYGFIVLWCSRISHTSMSRGGAGGVSLALLALLALLASTTFNYNRASVVIPLVVLAATYHVHVRRIRPVLLLAIGLVVVSTAAAFGSYRTTYTGTQGGTISAEQAGLSDQDGGLSATLQVYAGGPQFWGPVLADVERDGQRAGDTLLGSVLSPVPILGEPFREDSGPIVYNELIYGRPGVVDQILTAGAEAYWNFGAAGVAALFVGLGLIIRRLHHASSSSPALGTFTYGYLGAWLACGVIYSLSNVAQIFVFFLWPAYCLFFLTSTASGRSAVGRVGMTT